MFISVQSWILLGSWCCRCTVLARYTRSNKGPSYIPWISSRDQSCRITDLLFGVGVTIARNRLDCWVIEKLNGRVPARKASRDMMEVKTAEQWTGSRSRLDCRRYCDTLQLPVLSNVKSPAESPCVSNKFRIPAKLFAILQQVYHIFRLKNGKP